MASTEQVLRELDRLKKSDLIEILMNKTIPDSVKLSESVRKTIEFNESVPLIDGINLNSVDDSVKDNHNITSLKCELKCMKTELMCVNKINCELERTIRNQCVIIELLQMTKLSSPVSSTNKSVTDVASSTVIADKPEMDVNRIRNENVQKHLLIKSNDKLSPTTAYSLKNHITLNQAKTAITEAQNTINRKNNKSEPNRLKDSRVNNDKQTKIVGTKNNSECPLKVATNKVHLHVNKLEPKTTEEDMINYLVEVFPEVTVEKLKSKHSHYHSSFKVTINECNHQRAITPDVWPEGAEVRNFTYRKRIFQPFQPQRRRFQKK